MAAFTGSAVAGNGQGNDAAPGQQKQDQAAATQAAVPATAQPQQQAAHEPPGQAKKQGSTTASTTAAAASAQTSSQALLGVKPGSTTTHWTHCTTGGSPGATTCTSSDSGHTPQPNPDASKLYGNGKTAAQIAVSRGGSGVQLTGPGNSQPHKVTACGKKNNKSGGVDVHAVKSYSSAGCSRTTTPAAAGAVVAPVAQASVAASTSATSPVVPSSAATQGSPAAPVIKHVGGVLGVLKTLKPAKPAQHGVLGAVAHLSGSTLPFTGFPIWLAVVIGLALIPTGLTLRRRGVLTAL
jgi:hypothetical protein